jgi:hypothetical protein
MDEVKFSPEIIATGAKSLLSCAGWQKWYLPSMAKRVAEIEAALLEDLAEEETRKLRHERVIIKSWMERPDNALKEMKKVGAATAHAGAATV